MLLTGCPFGARPERSTASMVTAVSPSFCAASTTLAPPPRSSSILSRKFATSLRARSVASSFFSSGATLCIVGLDRRLDGADLDQRHAELALHRLADLAGRQREGRVRDRGIENARFGDEAEIDVGRGEIALLGDVVERRSRGDAAARGLGFLHVREDDLRDLALLGRAELVLAQLEQFFRVLVGDLRPLADVFRRDRDKGDLAIFGRAELGLVLVEIGGERLGRGRIDGAGLRRAKPQIVDRALLVLEMVQRLQQRLRRLEPGRDRAGELTPQRDPALVGEIARLGEAVLADDGLEARGIEAAAEALEIGIGIDHAHGLGVGLSEPELPRLFVKRGFGQIVWFSTWRSKPSARACSMVRGRPNWRPICWIRSV